MTEELLTTEKFSIIIENRMIKNPGSYIETVCDLMEEYDLEPAENIQLLSNPLLEKIRAEAKQNKLLKDEKPNLKASVLFA